MRHTATASVTRCGTVLPNDPLTVPAGGALITNAILYLGSAIAATPSNVSFPATALGASSVATTITFKNSSARAVDVIGLGLEGAGKAQFSLKTPLAPSPAAPLTLAGGASFTVEVRYKPQDQGTHQASLYVDRSTSSRTAVSLSGESNGSLYLVRSPVDFGGSATGATAGPVTVRILNTGSASVDLDKPVLVQRSRVVAPGLLDFTPPIYVGQTSPMQMFTIRNTGSIAIDNLSARLSGAEAADFRIALSGKSKLQPGESTDLGIVFAPQTPGAKTASIDVRLKGAATNIDSVSCRAWPSPRRRPRPR